MANSSKLYLLACVLSAIALFHSCDRSEESPEAAEEQAATGQTDDEPAQSAGSGGADGQAEQRPDRGASSAAVDVGLDALTRDAGFERVGDLPQRSLPPIPDSATRSTGLFEKDGERVGLVLVTYPREGFARPHIEDITFRSQQGDPVAMTAHGREVIEVRAAGVDAARRTATELAGQLNWPVVVPVGQAD